MYLVSFFDFFVIRIAATQAIFLPFLQLLFLLAKRQHTPEALNYTTNQV